VPAFITNYEALNTDLFKKFVEHDFTVVAVDEMHRLRGGANPGGPTKMWLALKSLLHDSDNKPFPIFMSGSLINNGNEEIWAYLHMFSPKQFPTLAQFKNVYLKLLRDGTLDKGELMKVIGTNFFRKTKAEVGITMKDKIFVDHIIELEKGTDLYDFQKEINDNFLLRLDEMGDSVVSISGLLAEMHYQRVSLVSPEFDISTPVIDPLTGERVKDAKGRPMKNVERRVLHGPLTKLDYIVDHVFELVMGEGENVILCSAAFNHPIAYLMARFREMGLTCDAITGHKALTTREASEIEDDFQQNKIQVLFLNLHSGAEGLNLNKDARWPGGSSHVGFIDRWWNPEINKQGEDRAWRLGCPEVVTIHRYTVAESVDGIVDGICAMKMQEAAGITEHTALRASEWRVKIAEWMKG